MDITQVHKLAELARISLTDEEAQSMLHDMQGILEYVKVIESVEVENIEGNYPVHNVWRDDVVIDREFSKDLIIEQFPDKQDNFLKVKKIL